MFFKGSEVSSNNVFRLIVTFHIIWIFDNKRLKNKIVVLQKNLQIGTNLKKYLNICFKNVQKKNLRKLSPQTAILLTLQK